MENLAKQARSRKRIEKIFETAENLLEQRGLDSITIANIAKYSDLKRTSTYKFFPTPDALKEFMINRYLNNCEKIFKEKTESINTDQTSVVVMRAIEIIYNFFIDCKPAQKLILSNTISPSLPSESIHGLSSEMKTYVESNIKLPEMFDKDGVFRVMLQIIISVFSLNVKENNSLNEIGKIEAHRAAHAYLLNWINQSS